jgi:uncharacterized protein YbjT (DUF2867 family)
MGEKVSSLRVILFGASGMVGSAVLSECLTDDRVEAVLCVGRSSCGQSHPKLKELLHGDLFDLGPLAAQLTGYNACFFTLGTSSVGMNEADYTRVTYDLTMAVANELLKHNPGLAFCFISGVGTDETEQGRVMWARIKGKAENALLRLPFRAAVMFRLGALLPVKGFRSKTAWIRVAYTLSRPLLPLLAVLFPNSIATPRSLGRAMIKAGLGEAPKARLLPKDFIELGR